VSVISRVLNARIPDSQLAIFERSGHSPFVEEPERFAQVMGAFAR
jgi:proline iminopeptidase